MNTGVLAKLISGSKQIKHSELISNHFDGISDISVPKFTNTYLAASSFDASISIYDISLYKESASLKGHTKGVWTCDFHPTKNELVSGGNDNSVILWDVTSAKQIKSLPGHSNAIYDVQFSEDGKLFGSCSKDLICVWDTANLSKPLDMIKQTKKEKTFIYCLNFFDNDSKIITGYIDGTIILHSINSTAGDDTILTLPCDYATYEQEDDQYAKSVFSITKFHSKPNSILLSHSDGSVRIYDIKEKKLELKDSFYYFTSPVTCAKASEDDKRIIACGKDRTAQIWKTDSHEAIDYTLSGHRNVISCTDFIGDSMVVTGSYDNSVRFWRL